MNPRLSITSQPNQISKLRLTVFTRQSGVRRIASVILVPSRRRHFCGWWSRSHKKAVSYNSQRAADAYQKVLRYRQKCARYSIPWKWSSGLWSGGFPNSLRASSSWGKSGGKQSSSGSKNAGGVKGQEQDNESAENNLWQELQDAHEKRMEALHEESEVRFQRFRDRYLKDMQKLGQDKLPMSSEFDQRIHVIRRWITEDPFRAVFSSNAERAWYPWQRLSFWNVNDGKENDISNANSEAKAKDNSSIPLEDPFKLIEESTSSMKNESIPKPTMWTTSEFRAESYIDPITNRRVTKINGPKMETYTHPAAHEVKDKQPSKNDEAVKVPVKKYAEPETMSDLGKEEIDALNPRSSSVLEGNRHHLDVIKPQPPLPHTEQKQSSQAIELPPKLESSLDRHLRRQNVTASAKVSGGVTQHAPAIPQSSEKLKPLVYDPIEDKTEDLDLLRPSDIRAHSGKIKERRPVESEEEAATRRKKAEEACAEEAQDRENRLKEELKGKDVKSIIKDLKARPNFPPRTSPKSTPSKSSFEKHESTLSTGGLLDPELSLVFQRLYAQTPSPPFERVKMIVDELPATDRKKLLVLRMIRHVEQQKLERLLGLLGISYKLQLSYKLIDEVGDLKVAMDKAEARRITKPELLGISKDGKDDGPPKPVDSQADRRVFEEKRKEREFVREIRDIYEDTYGMITTKHRQPAFGEISMKAEKSTAANEIGGLVAHAATISSRSGTTPEPPGTRKLVSQNSGARAEEELKESPEPQNNTLPSIKPLPELDTPEKKAQSRVAPKAGSDLYRIIAYDTPTNDIHVTQTNSSRYETEPRPRTVAGMLTHLNNPTKFFDHMETAEAEGYELIAGTRAMLVYKKTREPDAEMHVPKMQEYIVAFLRRKAEDMPDSSSKRALQWALDRDWQGLSKTPKEASPKSTVRESANPKTDANVSSTQNSIIKQERAEIKETLSGAITGTAQPLLEETSNPISISSHSGDTAAPAPKSIPSTCTVSKPTPVRREEEVFSGQTPQERAFSESQWQELERERRETYAKYARNQKQIDRMARQIRQTSRGSRGRATLRARLRIALGMLRRLIVRLLWIGIGATFVLYWSGVWAEYERRRRMEEKMKIRDWHLRSPGGEGEKIPLPGWVGGEREKLKQEIEGESGWSSFNDNAPKWYNGRHRWWWMDSEVR